MAESFASSLSAEEDRVSSSRPPCFSLGSITYTPLSGIFFVEDIVVSWLMMVFWIAQGYADPSTTEQNLIQLWRSKTEEELFIQIENLHYSGQFDEAQDLVHYLVNERSSVYAYYLWAQNMEYQRDFELAIDLYKDILGYDLEEAFQLDVYYRLGLAYDDWGKPKQAIKIWKKLLSSKILPVEHQAAVELLYGAAHIHAKHTRKGVEIITRALPKATRDQNWMKARARNALAMVLIAQADEIAIDARGSKAQIEKRFTLLKKAEEQVIASVELNKSAFVLRGVIQMIDAYLRMYDDARSISPPATLSYEASEHYFKKRADKSKTLLLRAENYTRKGLIYAQQMNWKGIELRWLEERRAALKREKKRRYSSK